MAIYMPRIKNPVDVDAVFKALRAGEKGPKAAAKPEIAHPKDDLVRSEPYRRLVASMPCKNCGRQGRSQAAHVPPDGKGIKVSDLEIFPLCTEGPGVQVGCHSRFDQFELMPKAKAVKQGLKWAAETRQEVIDAGIWPKGLPMPRKSPVSRPKKPAAKAGRAKPAMKKGAKK